MNKTLLLSIALLGLTADFAMAAGREVPGLTRTAFALACERSGGTVGEGSAGAANAVTCTLPNGTVITCGFAAQPPMCVWRTTPPKPFRDLFGGNISVNPDTGNKTPRTESGASSVGGNNNPGTGKGDAATGADSGPDSMGGAGGDGGPAVK